MGYPLTRTKLAFVGAYLGSSTAAAPYQQEALDLPTTAYTVRDAVTGALAFSGTSQSVTNSSLEFYSGQKVWALDFSALAAPGRYNIRIAGLGTSHAFLVSADAWRPLVGALARGLYGQRDGDPLDPLHQAPWTRSGDPLDPLHEAGGTPMALPPPKTFTDRYAVPNNLTTLPSVSGSYWLRQVREGGRRGRACMAGRAQLLRRQEAAQF